MSKKLYTIFNMDELIHAAFRYYLGRRTIAACVFAKDLASAWDRLGGHTRLMIGQELLRAYEDAETHPDWKPLGDDCDREAWDLVKEKVVGISSKTSGIVPLVGGPSGLETR
jgi:hypothetical protein